MSVFYNIFRSIAIVICVSVFFAGISSYFFPYTFPQLLIVAFCAQIIGYFLWKSVLDAFIAVNLRKLENELAIDLKKHTLEIECANCNEMHGIPMTISEEPVFKCGKCGVKNKIYVTAETAVMTTPLSPETPFTINEPIRTNTQSTSGN